MPTTRPPEFIPFGGRCGDVNGLRESDSGRLRASVRALLPAVATLAALFALAVPLAAVLPSADDDGVGGGLLNLLAQSARYAILIAGAVWLAARLERRSYDAFGMNVDGRWLRDVAAGVAASVLGVAASLWWGSAQGSRAVDLAGWPPTGPSALAVAAVLAVYTGYFLLGNVFEEVVYRRIALGNLAEGLTDRELSPRVAVLVATLASLALFGAYHVPLRGNVVVAVDAAMVGVTFALAYVLTGDLGLAIGVHFGRLPTVFMTGRTFAGVQVPGFVDLTRNTLVANLEVKLVEIGVGCVLVAAWVYATRGDLRLAPSVWDPDDG
jgi:membrane protease YdiL (CAAX protease family)